MGTGDNMLDVMYGYLECSVICPKCGKKYKCVIVEQEAGFRDKCEDVCPYCESVNGTSMEVEYINTKG